MKTEQDTIRIPSLSGGVSRQPAHNRFPDQVEDATNIRFSIEDGCSKRPGTEFVAEFASPGFGSGAAARIHMIERDEDEQYIALYGPNSGNTSFTLAIYDKNGNLATLNGYSGDVETYLETNIATNTANDYRFVTVADTTIIVNTTAAVGMEASATYSVSRTVRNYSDVLSLTPDNDEYVRAEEDDDLEASGYWKYTPEDDLEYAKITFPVVSGDWARPQGSWDDLGANEMPGGFSIGQSRLLLTGFATATYTSASRTITKAGAFTSYTYRPGDMIYITAGTGFTANAWYLIQSKTSNDAIVLAIQAKQTNTLAGADNADTAANDSDSKARIGNEAEVVVDFNADPKTNMFDIAAGIQDALRTAGWENGLVSWNPSSGGGYFEITGSFRGSDARVYAPTAPPTGGEDLTNASGDPFYATDAVTTAGTGSLSTKEPTQPASFRWTRVAAPGQTRASFSPEKMPVKLTRTDDSPLTFTLSTISWQDRLTGDELTNPAPDPFQNSGTTSAYIKDACYFEGRFAVAVGEYIIFSEADNLFNFFVADASQVVDSDRIFKPVGTNKIANIEYMVPYQKTILLLTASGQQYEVAFGDALTPSSVSIAQTTNYRTTTLRPVVMGPFVYFATDRGRDTAIWEYFYDESTGAHLATEITKHVSGYVPASLRTIVADSVQEALVTFVLDEASLYVYRAHWQGANKVQSAWGKYTLDAGYDIRDIGFMGGNIYMLVQTSAAWILERIPLSEVTTQTDFPFTIHLDRLLRIESTALTYSAPDTIIDLNGIDAAGSTFNTYVLTDGTVVKATDNGQSWKYGIAGGMAADDYIGVDGDITGNDIYIGRFYTATVQPSRPFRRDDRGRALTDERMVVQNLWVCHEDSGPYTVTRDHESANWDNATTTFTPTATTEDGYTRVPVRNDPDAEVLTIHDNGAKPMNISSLEYEVEVTTGARRN